MLNLTQGIRSEFPLDLIKQCQANANHIVRLSKGRNVADANSLTLLEQAEPQCTTFSDIFEVTDFSYDPKTQKGHIRADISLCQAHDHLEIDARILDLDTQTVVGQVPMVQAEHTSTLVIQEDFSLGNGVSTNLGVLAYGKWSDTGKAENELAILAEINHLDNGITYKHKRPKKEPNVEIIGNLESHATAPVEKGDDDHIVIALIRKPENTDDVDYICGFGRDKKGHPHLCVPGGGEFYFPNNETVASDAQHKNTAVCRLYRKEGGAVTIATSEAYKLDKINLQATDNVCTYDFVSWGIGYDDPAEWKKTEFEYRLELTIFTTYQGTWKRHFFFIDTRDPSKSITDEVKTLQIMYGCLAPDTKILMFKNDGSGDTQKQEVPISQIKIGDLVVGRDGSPIKVRNVWSGEESDPMIELWVSDLTEPVFMTKDHPVLVQDVSGNTLWKRAAQCSLNDKVLLADGQNHWSSIARLNTKESSGLVYNLELDVQDTGLKAMFSNGVLTGDQLVQNGDHGNGDC